MRKLIITLTALASLIIANATYGETPISWQNWNIVITDFQLTKTVNMENMFEKNPVAEEGNIFIELTIKIKNNGTKSDSFYPQNLVKLSVQGADIDAADVLTDRLSDRIEPFTTQLRKFYFEIPEIFEGESAELQFGGENFAVPVILPKQEKAVSVVKPTPGSGLQAELRVADLQAEFRVADADLTAAWNALSRSVRQRYLQQQREWISRKDRLSLEDRISATRTRTAFLQSLVSAN